MPTFWLKVAGWALLTLALAGAAAAFIHHQREIGAAPERARANRAEAAASAQAAARASDAATADLQKGALDVQVKDARRDAAAALASLAASQRLQQRAAALAAACHPASTAAPASGASGPADDAGYLLADMLGRVDEAARVLAKRADARRGSGVSCEGQYDALTPAQ